MMMRLAIFALMALSANGAFAAPGFPRVGIGNPGMGSTPIGNPGPQPIQRHRGDQDAARRALLDGDVMPFAVLKRRVEKQIGGDADYLGSEFMPDRNSYRLKYMRDRNVLWVDVDGRTGDITGWAR